MGWYYLNVSRLQNAADAAAVAGAHALIDNDPNLSDYTVKLVAQFPADLIDETTDISEGNEAAVLYAMKNLSNDTDATIDGEGYITNSNYSRGGDKTIKVTSKLYKDGDDLYYVVNMSEKIHHFFIGFSSLLGGETDDMSAPVVAVALITKDTGDNRRRPAATYPRRKWRHAHRRGGRHQQDAIQHGYRQPQRFVRKHAPARQIINQPDQNRRRKIADLPLLEHES